MATQENQQATSVELKAVQAALRAYEAARKSWPADQRQQMEDEFGALLIQLMHVGDQLHLDVFREADRFLRRSRIGR